MNVYLKKTIQCLVLVLVATSLSGCLVAAAGAGAASGYYFDKNYKLEKKDE